ncbi:MAG: ABC transporter permease [Oscillospiraceae bacterium]|nr:ABC transporter permease [Oscillospiraceae bacterium]
MKNPLIKRLPRELLGEAGKYLVIFLLMVFTIGFISGFLVADGSMITAYNESFEKYNIEDGHLRLSWRANRAQLKSAKELGITLYENFYTEEELTNGSTLRIFRNRDEVNRACLMEGAFPAQAGEIAIDRMYADNNGLQVGDTIESAAHRWTVTGLVALSDYSALFSDNNDTMFDSLLFGVAVVSPEEFARYDSDALSWCYAWKYDDGIPAEESEESDKAEELLKGLTRELTLEEFVPRFQNQSIKFTGEDMGSDRAMMVTLLYIVIAIMAFVFGITISNTITKEANVIGTLRASGYTRSELVIHYMTLPLVVTLLGALFGNILGYTAFKELCVRMYYNSYSLPTYVTIWSGEAFVLTTVVPMAIMLVVNFVILRRKLSLPPLKFLRRDITRRRQARAIPLPRRIPFFTRFRLRVFFQNSSNYAMLLVGILFANLLLLFGLGLPACLDHYKEEIQAKPLSNYQYILQVPLSAMNEDRKLESLISMMQFQGAVETENQDTEKFTAYSLRTTYDDVPTESIMVYGVQPDSRYIHAEIPADGVLLSSSYADKFELEPGDTILLKEVYEDTYYSFRVAGVYDYIGAMAIFLDQSAMNELFELGDDYFSGYFSDTEITDIDEQYIGSVIDMSALTKISRQLDKSMGSMMYLVDGFAVLIFMILIYLLSKIIIEKNAQSISMAKILGYTDGEIGRLYLLSTSIVTVILLLISLPIVYQVLVVIFRIMMQQEMTGWIPLYIERDVYIKMFLLGLATYAVVAALEYRRIRRIPMDEALKNVE